MKNGALRCAVFFVALMSAACGMRTLSAPEMTLAMEVGFDPTVVSTIRARGESLSRLQTFARDDFRPIAGPGLLLTTQPKQGEATLRALRADLEHTPYQAWLYENRYGSGPDEIAILKSRDPIAYLQVIPINGTNYDIDHDQIIAKYREWEPRLGLELTGAGGDWLSAEITRDPADWDEFAKEVYAFCPDVVEQGTNDVPSLARAMRERKTLFLWWD